ncbi:hypothetical protein TURU_095738 [Turdus rufiventris]|nr:hypothetical protein TURU_095738 [Turdus rufiventris]
MKAGCEWQAVGVQIKLDLLQRKFWMAMQQCSAVDGACPLSCQDDILNCFLIDNNGFILVSKIPEETGKFFGAVDGSVMTQLLNMGMFRRVTMYDYQAMCKVPYHHHSGAQPLLSVRICHHAALPGLAFLLQGFSKRLSGHGFTQLKKESCNVWEQNIWGKMAVIGPIYAFVAAVKWLISDFLIFLLEFNMSSFWHSDNLADAHKHKKHDMLQPCDTEYPVFVYEPAIKETNGLINCGDCQKMFVAQQIISSNLLLLVTDTVCDCSVFPPVPLDAKEENAQDCGGTAGISVCPALLLLPLVLLLR